MAVVRVRGLYTVPCEELEKKAHRLAEEVDQFFRHKGSPVRAETIRYQPFVYRVGLSMNPPVIWEVDPGLVNSLVDDGDPDPLASYLKRHFERLAD